MEGEVSFSLRDLMGFGEKGVSSSGGSREVIGSGECFLVSMWKIQRNGEFVMFWGDVLGKVWKINKVPAMARAQSQSCNQCC